MLERGVAEVWRRDCWARGKDLPARPIDIGGPTGVAETRNENFLRKGKVFSVRMFRSSLD